MEQFTASEVRDEIAGMQCAIDNAGFGSEGRAAFASYAMDNIGKWKRMLRAFADLLEAREKAVPVAYALFTEKGLLRMWAREWFADVHGAPVNLTPLYTHPAPSDAERLAEALERTARHRAAMGSPAMADTDFMKKNYIPTTELRFLILGKNPFVTALQQKFRSPNTEIDEWRNVPIVEEPHHD